MFLHPEAFNIGFPWANYPYDKVLVFGAGTYEHFAEGDVQDRIKMITSSFAAFSRIAASVNTTQREDIRGVAILLYSGMFPTMVCCEHTFLSLQICSRMSPLKSISLGPRYRRSRHCSTFLHRMRGTLEIDMAVLFTL